MSNIYCPTTKIQKVLSLSFHMNTTVLATIGERQIGHSMIRGLHIPQTAT